VKRIFSSRPSPAFVIACIALFASMGGVSYAVATGSIDSREIKDNTIRGKDMRANSITAREIKRRSLDGTDIKIERVGGEAVKEQVLESEKIGKVNSAASADNAANAGNAAALGGRGADKYLTRWALVNEQGQIEAQTGGFTIANCYKANANCYINAGEDVRNNGIHAQIAIANPMGSAILSGETGTAPCGATFVACAPPGTEDNNVIVVAPRKSDGTSFGSAMSGAPTPEEAARFYVYVTGSESTTTP
jgi:hypothetical protein